MAEQPDRKQQRQESAVEPPVVDFKHAETGYLQRASGESSPADSSIPTVDFTPSATGYLTAGAGASTVAGAGQRNGSASQKAGKVEETPQPAGLPNVQPIPAEGFFEALARNTVAGVEQFFGGGAYLLGAKEVGKEALEQAQLDYVPVVENLKQGKISVAGGGLLGNILSFIVTLPAGGFAGKGVVWGSRLVGGLLGRGGKVVAEAAAKTAAKTAVGKKALDVAGKAAPALGAVKGAVEKVVSNEAFPVALGISLPQLGETEHMVEQLGGDLTPEQKVAVLAVDTAFNMLPLHRMFKIPHVRSIRPEDLKDPARVNRLIDEARAAVSIPSIRYAIAAGGVGAVSAIANHLIDAELASLGLDDKQREAFKKAMEESLGEVAINAAFGFGAATGVRGAVNKWRGKKVVDLAEEVRKDPARALLSTHPNAVEVTRNAATLGLKVEASEEAVAGIRESKNPVLEAFVRYANRLIDNPEKVAKENPVLAAYVWEALRDSPYAAFLPPQKLESIAKFVDPKPLEAYRKQVQEATHKARELLSGLEYDNSVWAPARAAMEKVMQASSKDEVEAALQEYRNALSEAVGDFETLANARWRVEKVVPLFTEYLRQPRPFDYILIPDENGVHLSPEYFRNAVPMVIDDFGVNVLGFVASDPTRGGDMIPFINAPTKLSVYTSNVSDINVSPRFPENYIVRNAPLGKVFEFAPESLKKHYVEMGPPVRGGIGHFGGYATRAHMISVFSPRGVSDGFLQFYGDKETFLHGLRKYGTADTLMHEFGHALHGLTSRVSRRFSLQAWRAYMSARRKYLRKNLVKNFSDKARMRVGRGSEAKEVSVNKMWGTSYSEFVAESVRAMLMEHYHKGEVYSAVHLAEFRVHHPQSHQDRSNTHMSAMLSMRLLLAALSKRVSEEGSPENIDTKAIADAEHVLEKVLSDALASYAHKGSDVNTAREIVKSVYDKLEGAIAQASEDGFSGETLRILSDAREVARKLLEDGIALYRLGRGEDGEHEVGVFKGLGKKVTTERVVTKTFSTFLSEYLFRDGLEKDKEIVASLRREMQKAGYNSRAVVGLIEYIRSVYGEQITKEARRGILKDFPFLRPVFEHFLKNVRKPNLLDLSIFLEEAMAEVRVEENDIYIGTLKIGEVLNGDDHLFAFVENEHLWDEVASALANSERSVGFDKIKIVSFKTDSSGELKSKEYDVAEVKQLVFGKSFIERLTKDSNKHDWLLAGELIRMNKFMKNFLDVHQLARLNPHIPELQELDAITRRWEENIHTVLAEAKNALASYQMLPEKERNMLRIVLFKEDESNTFAKMDELENGRYLVRIGGHEFEVSKKFVDAYWNIRKFFVKNIERIMDQIIKNAHERGEDTKQLEEELKDMIRRPYFPHSRFGRYILILESADTGHVIFKMFESKKDRDREAQDAKDSGAYVRVITDEKPELAVPFVMLPEGVIARVLEDPSVSSMLSDEMKAMLRSTAAKLGDEKTARRFLLPRKGTPGYSTDIERVFADYALAVAHFYTRLREGRAFSELSSRITESIRKRSIIAPFGLTDQTVYRRLQELIEEHKNTLINPREEATRFRLMVATYYLALNGVHVLLNLLQFPVFVLPIIAARFGFSKAISAMHTALMGWKKSKYADEISEGLAKALKKGIIDESLILEVAGVAMEASGKTSLAHGVWSHIYKASRFLLYPFHYAEVVARKYSYIAAYIAAREKGLNSVGAEMEAFRVVEEGMFDYSRPYRPLFMRGKMATVTIFFTWFQKAFNLFVGTYGKKEALYALSMFAATAGVFGLPFVEDLLDLLSWLYRHATGQFVDFKKSIEHYAEELFGDFAQILAFGAFSSIPTPFGDTLDLSQSFGAGHFVPGMRTLTYDPLLATPQDRILQFLADAGGAGVSAAISWLYPIFSPHWDFYTWYKFAPTFVKNAIQGYEIAKYGGIRMPDGSTIPVGEPSILRGLMRAAGLKTTEESRIQDAYYFERSALAFFAARKRRLSERLSYELRNGSADDIAEVIRMIVRHNLLAPPDYRISFKDFKDVARLGRGKKLPSYMSIMAAIPKTNLTKEEKERIKTALRTLYGKQ